MKLQGGCLCGAVRFHLEGTVHKFYFCHCSRCQKSSGSAHSSNLFFKNGSLVWEQGENLCADYRHKETRFSKRFCTRCACPLPQVVDEKHKIIQVPAGSLEGEHDFEPTAHIFTDFKSGWEEALAQTPKFPALPQT